VQHDDIVIKRLIGLGDQHDEIRAVVLTSTRAAGGCDLLSDYDVVLYTRDLARFLERDDWFESFGRVLVMFRDDSGEGGWHARLVLYEDGTRVDFSVQHVDLLKQACQASPLPEDLDVGYHVLLDKDGLAASLPSPTFKAHIPSVPTAKEYATAANEFWWNAIYVAKHLWRDEPMGAHFMLDYGLRHDRLRVMLEWAIEIERGWSWRPGIYGKGIEKELDAESRRELADSYAGADPADVWRALFCTAALFRKTAIKVAAALGYEYPHDLDRRVRAYLRTIERLDRRTVSREALAGLLSEAYGGGAG